MNASAPRDRPQRALDNRTIERDTSARLPLAMAPRDRSKSRWRCLATKGVSASTASTTVQRYSVTHTAAHHGGEMRLSSIGKSPRDRKYRRTSPATTPPPTNGMRPGVEHVFAAQTLRWAHRSHDRPDMRRCKNRHDRSCLSSSDWSGSMAWLTILDTIPR